MKICHLAYGFSSECWGGTSVRLFNLLKYLEYKIDLYAGYTEKTDLDEKEINISQNIRLQRVHFTTNPYKRFSPVLGVFTDPFLWHQNSKKMLHAIKNKDYNLIHGHNPFSSALTAMSLAKKLNKPFIYEAHGLIVDSHIRRIYSSKISPIYNYIKFLEKKILLSADSIIAITEALKKRIISIFHIPEEKITVIPNGIDPTFFNLKKWEKRAKELRERLNLTNKIVVMYSGYLDRLNGVDFLLKGIIEISKKRNDIVCLILGRGVLKNLVIEKSKSYENIRYLGGIPYKDMPLYYSLCDIYVIPRPSIWMTETITPIKLFEAMQMERIVIVSDVGGMKEIVEDGKSGYLFEKENMEDFKEKVLSVAEKLDPSVGINARKKICQYYTWEKSAGILKDIYNRFEKTLS